MDDQHPNPLFHRFVDSGPTPPSTCGDRPTQSLQPKQPPAAIRRLISELGLRYRPSNQADLEAHAAMIALLARDLADIPESWLARAISIWVSENRFMPKAAELIEIAQMLQRGETRQRQSSEGERYWREQCVAQNAKRDEAQDIPEQLKEAFRWAPAPSGGMYLRSTAVTGEGVWECPDWLTRYNEKLASGEITSWWGTRGPKGAAA